MPGPVPYAELHCHSNFSFLDGASHPEELAEEAARLGLEALAVTDHDGFYGVVRFAEAARAVGLATVFGTELTLDGPVLAPVGEPDPPGEHLVVLARSPAGYAALARAASSAQLAGQKGAPRIGLGELADLADDHWALLTGCRKGPLAAALDRDGPGAAGRALDRLVDAFGRDHVQVELWDHGDPLDGARNDALAEVAVRRGVGLVATNNVHYATPDRRRLATALAAVRSRRSLAEGRRVAARRGRGPPALGSRAGPALRPLPRGGRRRGRPGPGLCVRPAPGGPQAAAVPLPRWAERDGVPAPPGGARSVAP